MKHADQDMTNSEVKVKEPGVIMSLMFEPYDNVK